MKTQQNFFKIASIFLLLISVGIKAQEIRLNAYTAYAFDDNIHSYDLDGTLQGGFIYGGGIEMKLGPFYGAELLYQRLDSKLPYKYNDGINYQTGTFNYGLNYIMFGSNRYLPLGRIEPFFGLLLGMAVIDIKDQPINDITKFAWGLRLGSNINLSPRIALRLQAQLTSIVQSAGGGLYFGSGGITPTVNTYSSMYQFNLGGGLVIKLPSK